MSTIVKWARFVIQRYPCCGRRAFIAFPCYGAKEAIKHCLHCDVYYIVRPKGKRSMVWLDY